ncbi:DHH family phosphoesterase [Pasteuria penetrans]|uniref:DHH family phosphoesterase n=1 Tax=Pasteuria penetrans TaxID=86005 RepID=UPI00165BB43A|nr:DHH family phosphoesterase [Pasteuria penetrans]
MPRWVGKRWPGYRMLAMAGLLSSLFLFFLSERIGVVVFIGCMLCALAVVQYILDRVFERSQFQYILSLGEKVRESACYALDHLPVGVLLYNEDRKIIWHNSFLHQLDRVKESHPPKTGVWLGKPITDLFPNWRGDERRMLLRRGDRLFQVENDIDRRILLVRDHTHLERLKQRYRDERVALGLLHIDNCDEAKQTLPDQESALLLTSVLGSVSQWAEENDVVIKSIDTDHMFFVLRQRSMQRLMASRFHILDQIRDLTRSCRVPITLSLGIASMGKTLSERSRHAREALDMALVRGGDQVAVQVGEKMRFYGGQSNAVEKRTRVRARTVARSLAHLVCKSQRVLVMGHVQPDLDSLGACLGVSRLAELHGRKAHIISDSSSPAVHRLQGMIDDHEVLSKRFVGANQARIWAQEEDTLVLLVDTHLPSLSQEPEVLAAAKRVVVIDHHRRGEEFVCDPVLVYLEPSASSTCELVAELLQYQNTRLSLDPLEATALLAGIVMDTRHFSVRTGARTFDAASFLRRYGADLALVQSFLEEDWDRYIQRTALVRRAYFLHKDLAIAVAPEDFFGDQVVIAQVADTLLSMHGVEASFAIARRMDGVVSISARSSGRYNVQLFMEGMGGGGHLTHAACQLEDVSLEEAHQRLLLCLQGEQS